MLHCFIYEFLQKEKLTRVVETRSMIYSAGTVDFTGDKGQFCLMGFMEYPD
jgi:hypothetical protein